MAELYSAETEGTAAGSIDDKTHEVKEISDEIIVLKNNKTVIAPFGF